MFFNGMRLFKIFFLFTFIFSCFRFSEALADHGVSYVPSDGSKLHSEKSISSGAMVNQPTASTLRKNHGTAGFTFDYLRFNSIPAGNAHELHDMGRDIHGKNHEEIYNLHAGFGVTDDVTLYLAAPIVSRTSIQIEDHDHLGRGERSTGFGDMRLIVKYRFWKKYVEAAILAAVKFPTGKTDNKDQSRAKFETEQQPGSGSWDGEFGIVLSRSLWQRISAATSFQYALRGEGAQDRKLGDAFYYNVGASVAARKLGQYPNLSLILELNNRWSLRDHSRAEDRVFDSGGTAIFVTPGFHLDLTQHFSAFWGIPIPIYQNLGGEHEELKFGMLAGASVHI